MFFVRFVILLSALTLCYGKAHPDSPSDEDRRNKSCIFYNNEPNVVAFVGHKMIVDEETEHPPQTELVFRCKDFQEVQKVGKYSFTGSIRRRCIDGDWDGEKAMCDEKSKENDYAEFLELGSGEGGVPRTTKRPLYLIDDNGDIATTQEESRDLLPNMLADFTTPGSIPDFIDEESKSTTMKEATNDSLPTDSIAVITEISTELSTDSTTVKEKGEPSDETTTEDAPTTTTPTTDTSTMSSTTIQATTVEETTTIGMKLNTTTSTAKTTTSTMGRTTIFSSTPSVTEKSEKPISHSPNTQLEHEGEKCEFQIPDFECNREVVCFGEGEIDCDIDETQFIVDKMLSSSSSSTSEDYIDDEISESDTIGTFPPALVGVGTPKKISFYNMQSFTTDTNTEEAMVISKSEVEIVTNNSLTETDDDVNKGETEPAVTTEYVSTVVTTEAFTMSSEPTADPLTLESIANDDAESVSEMVENITTETPFSFLSEGYTMLSNSSLLHKKNYTESLVPAIEESNDTFSEDSLIHGSEHVRRRRGFFSSSDQSGDAKRKYVDPVCRLSGSIKCMPIPTTGTCRGKTFCRAPVKVTDPEASKSKTLQFWIIIAIVVTVVLFAATGVFAYMVHSYKKQKVQPAQDVMSLNYMSKKSESVETA